MNKAQIKDEIFKLYRSVRRTPFSAADRVQQHVKLFWKIEDLAYKLGFFESVKKRKKRSKSFSVQYR